MNTYQIRIAGDAETPVSAFSSIFDQFHELAPGKAIALEIRASQQNISFGFAASKQWAESFGRLLYSIAPSAEIESQADQIDLYKSGFVAHARLTRTDIFPIRLPDLPHGDPLSPVLALLSTVPTNCMLQLIVTPRRDTLSHQTQLLIKRSSERATRQTRVKYWFKREVAQGFSGAIANKCSARLFDVSLRFLIAERDQNKAREVATAMSHALASFNTHDHNQIGLGRLQPMTAGILRRRHAKAFLLSAAELAGLYHFPQGEVSIGVTRLLSRREPPSHEVITSSAAASRFGRSNFRNQHSPIGIRKEDRRRHVYVVGKSGVGKSKLLEKLIINDIYAGNGVGVLDPHGDLVDNILQAVPKERIKDVVLFDPSDTQHPPALNPLEHVGEHQKIPVTVGFLEIFKKLFGANWTPRLEHVLRNTVLALLDSEDSTILSILQMLTDKSFRQDRIKNIRDDVVRHFWVNEFAAWSEKFDSEAITPLLNKVGQFVATDLIRNIVGQPKSLISFREVMDGQKILLMKISKGILGEENAALLGAMAVTKIYQAAMSRADTPEAQRKDFLFYVDEFHTFATNTFDEILSESRKYRLSLTIAHQFLGQLNPTLRQTVFGNIGSLITFRVGAEDAQVLSRELGPRFQAHDLINLGVQEFVCKLSVHGQTHEAFSGRTETVKMPDTSYATACIAHSRTQYTNPVKPREVLAPPTTPEAQELYYEEPVV